MAGPGNAVWVKVKGKGGRMTTRAIGMTKGGGNFSQGQVITQSEFNEVRKKAAEGKQETPKQSTSSRLAILEASLKKKEEALNSKFDAHFSDVASANGQPLNDKRNGRQTTDRWDRQSDGIRAQQQSITRTKEAIAREKGKIANVEEAKSSLPRSILKAIEEAEITQWRKHPNRFFVPGVDKARIVFEDGQVKHQYLSSIKDPEQWRKFAGVYNKLKNAQGQ